MGSGGMGIFSRSGSRKSGEKRDWLRRLVIPTGHGEDPKTDARKRAAAEDVTQIREDDKYFDPEGPENRQDEL
jgi:hypothetical protein